MDSTNVFANFYIDESGSMTSIFSENHPYFVICLVKVLDRSKLKKIVKRFFSANPEYLTKQANQSVELKGSRLSIEQKIAFANYLKRKGLLELYYIKVKNRLIQKTINNHNLYQNKARAFNYLLSKDFEHLGLSFKVNDSYIYLHIDNRNLKNEAKLSLVDYLNVYLCFEKEMFMEFKVDYFDSKNIIFIQIADFFSNLYYSSLFDERLTTIISDYKNIGLIKDEFEFPLERKIWQFWRPLLL